jgi:hypothetical protein
MKISERLERLERMAQAGEDEQTSLSGLIQIVGHGPTVEACAYQPPMPIIASGAAAMSELWERNEWRTRADCPDAGECGMAGNCIAAGKPDEKTNSRPNGFATK